MYKLAKRILQAIAKMFSNPCWDCEEDRECFGSPKCPRSNDEEK